jgi:trans-aconitate 2-methyltransferase
MRYLERITHLDRFKEHFADWKQPWHFAKAEDASKLLQEIGYVNTKVYYSDDCVTLNRRIYSKFVKTVVMKSYLDHLLSHNDDYDSDKLKDLFLELFLDEVEKYSNAKINKTWFLDFVRLNIIAHKPHA